jgi:plastocyanin
LSRIHRSTAPGASTAWVLVALLLSGSVVPAGAQSVLNRTPNLTTGWVGLPSTLHLDLLQRFGPREGSESGVDQLQTVLLAWGIGGYSLLGVHYTSASGPVSGPSAEWELLGRFSPLSTAAGAPVGLGLTVAWNEGVGSLDGEVTVTVPTRHVDVVTALRGFSDGYGEDDGRWAFGVGAVLHLGRYVALAADVTRPFSLQDDEAHGWSAALQLGIPRTPLSLSLQAANTRSATLQGSSRRFGGTHFGFELAVPITPGRFLLGGSRAQDPGARAGETDLIAADTVLIEIRDFAFGDERVIVRPGTYVRWTNRGESIHSVTAISGQWQSPLMGPGETFGRIFTEVGEHPYRSTPHPSMEAVLIVREGGGS